MGRAVCAGLFHKAPVAMTGGAALAGFAAWRRAVASWLPALLWYPLDRFLLYLAGWGSRPPSHQDRT